MSNPGQLLLSHPNAPWLPAGGRADVVLAGRRTPVPAPTCLVRLLVARERSVLAAPRADGRGLDLPTLGIDGGTAEERLQELKARTLGGDPPATLLGYVRNVVQEAPADYPWPSPDAYFAVWHCQVPASQEASGVWLDGAEAEARLGGRHWWPLAAHRGR